MSAKIAGLWLTGLRVEIQSVRASHRVKCVVCGAQPTVLRVAAVQGSGRSRTSAVMCRDHGMQFFELLERECRRAQEYLDGNPEIREAGIRIRTPLNIWPFDVLIMAKRKKEKDRQNNRSPDKV